MAEVMQPRLEIGSLLLVSTLLVAAVPCQAQVTSAIDGTQTIVQHTGNTFSITGGTTAGNNLFHSFQQFGLTQGQVASFLANPAIQNVLGRVTGGKASVINGLLQVTGSHANLYLMNPAGIVFGANARLDVAGSFTATTANGIGFGARWLNAVGANNYATLIGNPSRFAFTMTQPGAIVNAGNLAVGTGQSLTLLGGTVINTGALTAPEGEVTIAAIPGEKLVRLTPTGSLLSLDLPTATKAAINPQPFNPLTLPELLTGGNLSGATGVTVENGIVTLTGSGVVIPTNAGVAIVSGQVSTNGTIGGTVNVLGQKVGLVGATIDASGTNGGGTVLIGGDYKGGGTLPKAQQTYVSPDSIIQADALQTGNGGRAIVWADQRTEFYGTIRAQGGAQAGDGGFVEVSSSKTLLYRGAVDTSAPNGKLGTLLLDPENIVVRSGTQDGDDNGIVTNAFGNNLTGDNAQVRSSDAAPTIIYESELEGLTTVANIILEASNDIIIQDLTDNTLTIPALTGAGTDRGTITFTADADGNGIGNFVMNPGDTLRTNARDLTITGANITVGDVNTAGAADVAGSINIVGRTIETGNLRTGFGFSDTSSVTLTATTGDVIVKTIRAGGGGIDIKAARYFRATDFFITFLRTILDPVEDAELIQFLSRGNPQSFVDLGLLDGVRQVQISLPVSLLTFPDSGPAPIRIQHGGEARTVGGGQVQIQGTGSFPNVQFIVGPNNDHTITVNPGGGGFSGTFEGFSTLFPPNTFPADRSGATGAIVRGQGDATLVTSLQNRPFDPTRVVTDTSTGTSTSTGTTNDTTTSSTGGDANTARFRLGEEGQAAQRQLNIQKQASACVASGTIASSSIPKTRSPRATTASASNPCASAAQDDAQILKILGE
ncbi:MAG: filamentous hemagglutinin N-terminal domain-containing protein [Stenomitos frigidus ULC029]